MAVLAYCITEAEPEIEVPEGLEGRAIRSLQESGLRCLISDYGNESSPKSVRESALTFSRVLQGIFAQVAIIPFCFPTLLPNETEISAFVREHAPEYREALSRLRDSVQMEVRISFQEPQQKPEPRDQSGTDYLRRRQTRHQKLEAVAQEFRSAGQPWIRDWREREMAGSLRGYALVARASISLFVERMAHVPVPADLNARLTGPWPATEFLKEK